MFGIGESSVQELINNTFPEINDYYELGFRAQLGQVELKLRLRQQLHNDALEKADNAYQRCLDSFAPYIANIDGGSVCDGLINILQSQGKSLALAESCTGGLIASLVTQKPGVSDTFLGAIVSYSNAVKTQQLGVKQHSLDTDGAVSETVALEMLFGALKQLGSDVAIAVTGIAGPGGGW